MFTIQKQVGGTEEHTPTREINVKRSGKETTTFQGENGTDDDRILHSKTAAVTTTNFSVGQGHPQPLTPNLSLGVNIK